MGLSDELTSNVATILREEWDFTDGISIPQPEHLRLGNEARYFDRATVLYADLSGSTRMVDEKFWTFSGEIYKTFLHCAAKVIRSEGGEITAYDGDRIMAIFLGTSQTTSAAKCGLHINWVVRSIINPAINKVYPLIDFTVQHVVGIDTSELRAVRIGVRGGNDLVWIGRAANYAAKLTECRPDYPTFLTQQAYEVIADSSKFSIREGINMWTEFNWENNGQKTVYGSNWSWVVK